MPSKTVQATNSRLALPTLPTLPLSPETQKVDFAAKAAPKIPTAASAAQHVAGGGQNKIRTFYLTRLSPVHG
jgi:hypothetical protein